MFSSMFSKMILICYFAVNFNVGLISVLVYRVFFSHFKIVFHIPSGPFSFVDGNVAVKIISSNLK